jgi:hypothetical protein
MEELNGYINTSEHRASVQRHLTLQGTLLVEGKRWQFQDHAHNQKNCSNFMLAHQKDGRPMPAG